MQCRPLQNRSTAGNGLATSASTLIALVAIATAMSSISAMAATAHARGLPVEARSALNEVPTVRAVAEAVAAAARELAGTERVVPNKAILSADHFADELTNPVAVIATSVHIDDAHAIHDAAQVGERLLNLPPPQA